MDDAAELLTLRREIEQMLSAALTSDTRHEADMARRDELHIAETDRRDELHVREIDRRNDLHADETAAILSALETRDIIGQAKGVIIASMNCTADEAFHLIRQQSQHENRKLVEVAADIANRASARAAGYRPPAEG